MRQNAEIAQNVRPDDSGQQTLYSGAAGKGCGVYCGYCSAVTGRLRRIGEIRSNTTSDADSAMRDALAGPCPVHHACILYHQGRT